MDRATASFLQGATLWRRLPKPLLAEALRATTRTRVSRRRALWQPDDPATDVYVVRSGVVRISRPNGDDEGLTLSYLGRGELCGEVGALAALLGAPTHRHTRAVAHEDTVLLAMTCEALARFVAAHAEAGSELAALMAARRQAVESRLSRLPFQSVPQRLVGALESLATSFGVRDARGILLNLRLTHRDLAALVGSTRETVSATLARWRREGAIETDGRRFVLPSDRGWMAGGDAPHILPRPTAETGSPPPSRGR